MTTKRSLAGRWRIVEAEAWDREALETVGAAHLTLGRDGLGELQLLTIQADVDYRPSRREDQSAVEFSWEGVEENDRVSGRGWARLDRGELRGHLFIHRGDDSAFLARRE
jgi:hypothetical protein